MDAAVTMHIARATLDAYRATRYLVDTGSAWITLRIGLYNEDLALLHARHATPCSCFVTACNPFGVEARPEANEQACRDLLAWLVGEGLVCFRGEGRGDDRDWLPEPSYLVLGVDRDRALELCRRFHQNAVVWTGEDATPQLLLHPQARAAG